MFCIIFMIFLVVIMIFYVFFFKEDYMYDYIICVYNILKYYMYVICIIIWESINYSVIRNKLYKVEVS